MTEPEAVEPPDELPAELTPELPAELTPEPRRFSPAKPPAGMSYAIVVGALVALALVALGAVAIRDGLILVDATHGRLWMDWFAAKAAVLVPADWMIWVGIICVLLGFWALVIGVRPRPKRHLSVGDAHLVWIRARDCGRIAEDAAGSIGAVRSTRVKAKHRNIRLQVVTAGDLAQVADSAERAANSRLSSVQGPPQVRVRAIGEDES